MKKTACMILSVLANTAFLSLGMECLLILLSLSMASSLAGTSVTEQYPRFIPFCVVLGIVALIGLIAVLVINIKASEKLNFTKTIWIFECILVFVLSLPVMKLWETLLDFLQKTF